jgi:hypothetical protein
MSDIVLFCFSLTATGVTFSCSSSCPLFAEANKMLDADFWFDQATMFRQQADAVRDPEVCEEFRALAKVCDAVACNLEEHAPGG